MMVKVTVGGGTHSGHQEKKTIVEEKLAGLRDINTELFEAKVIVNPIYSVQDPYCETTI
jgi:hypothetical protein